MNNKTYTFLFCFLTAVFLSVNSELISQNVSVSDDAGYNAHSSAMLDVSSTTKGILIPRMTSDERSAISSPAPGLLIYQTNNSPGFYYNNGSIWIRLTDITSENDPVFGMWDKSTGISISHTQINDMPAYLESETDPAFTGAFDLSGANNGDLLKYNGSKWVKFTPDYLSASHTHDTATAVTPGFMSSADKSKLGSLQAPDGSETKLSSGTNVSITGTGTTGDPYIVNASAGGSHYLGEVIGDGIVYYLYTGSDGLQHGLMVSKTFSYEAYCSGSIENYGTRTWDGAYNTDLMVSSAAKTWVQTLGEGWYIPSIDELTLLYLNRFHVNKTLSALSLTLLHYGSSSYYWSSTESSSTQAIGFYFLPGNAEKLFKTQANYVRGVKSF